MTTEIRIYVADLAAYNAGFLHGAWIDATLEVGDIQDQVNEMLQASPVCDAEEYAIHDYEGFGGYSLGEYAGLESAHDIAAFLSEFPETSGALLSHFGDLDDARKAAEDSYIGCYKSLADYAQEITEETTEIPQNLSYYIDYEAMARDMEMNGDVFTITESRDQVHIFWSH
jgi:antirestriction protein